MKNKLYYYRFSLSATFLIIIIVLQIFSLFRSDYFVYPEIFIYPYLTKLGMIPYKEIVDQHFPGLFFLPINFLSIGMDTIQNVRMFHIFLIICDQLIIFYLVFKKSKKFTAALLSSFLYLVFYIIFDGNIFWIENIITTLFLLNVLFIYQFERTNKPYNLIFAGFFIGSSILMKQTSIFLFGLTFSYLILSKASRKELLFYYIGPFVSFLYLGYYILNQEISQDFYRWAIEFNLKYYGELASKMPSIRNLILTTVFFGALPFILWIKKRSIFDVYLILLAIFTLTYAYPRFELLHLKPALAIATIIIGSFYLEKFGKWIMWTLLLLGVLLAFITIENSLKVDSQNNEILEVIKYVEDNSNPGDVVFSFASIPHINFLTNTSPPGIYVVQLPWYMVLIEEDVLDKLSEESPDLIVKSKISTLDGIDTYKYMPKIVKYVGSNYIVLAEFDNYQVLVPRESNN